MYIYIYRERERDRYTIHTHMCIYQGVARNSWNYAYGLHASTTEKEQQVTTGKMAASQHSLHPRHCP